MTIIVGIQTPRLKKIPAYHTNAYLECVELCKAYGLVLDEWQQLCMEAWLGENEDGYWTSPNNGLSVPRQNGKGATLEGRELFGAIILNERILHTAHLLKTTKDHFSRMLAYVDGVDEVRRAVKKVTRVNGDEAIHFKNGGVIKFIARSKNSGRGFTADLLVCDEAQDMSEDDFAALQPTLFSAPNPQTILTGTPPVPTVDAVVWSRFRERGLDPLTQDGLSWLEWSAEMTDDYSDETVWAKANPALGIRASVENTRNEFQVMDEERFCRERLGMWAGIGSNSVIDMEHWATLASNIDPADPVAFAIDVSPDRDMACIGVAGYLGDSIHVQVIEHRRGTGWVVPRLKELKERWNPVAIVIDQGSPAASLIPDLQNNRIRFIQTTTADVTLACGSFYDRVRNERLLHANQPALNAALAVATKRNVRDAWAWQRRNPNADITPLVAVTLAAHGLTTKRKQRHSSEPVDNTRKVRLL